ncbi:2OG-Fe(II) oxygenase [Nocardia sp. NEAU-G5]|uniref:2OG-Fe(II) oxygenase n=1 Tax=Nocardia albiluteola TaxID=2842303 RepID=A0ABS6APL7_9NOCA|nr:2OG-Fe(II) oxygenase [Nocardia albiluteola]MBU3059962.1 2OG-Fe(II) oxygenase [Nocardia albiluteola]
MGTETPLPRWFTGLLAHRRWIRRTEPFPHVYVREVFTRPFYDRLAAEFERVRLEQPELFEPVGEGSGATGVNLARVRNGPLELFLSRAWHDLIARLVGAQDAVTGDIEGALHHHAPAGPRGLPRHDLTRAWFAGPAPAPDAVGLAGADANPGIGPGDDERELVRAVAVLFYLGNDEWRPGSGGETALLSAADPSRPQSAVHVPPLNNSMVVFECTPRSWHTFAGGNTAARNSVVMWLYQTREQAEFRWGGAAIGDR